MSRANHTTHTQRPRKQLQLRWARLTLHRRELGAIVLMIALATVVLFGGMRFGFLSPPINAGFGPDWDCTPVPNGQPICVKKTPTPASR